MYMIAGRWILVIAFVFLTMLAALFSISCGNSTNDTELPSNTVQPTEQPRNGSVADTMPEPTDSPEPLGTPGPSSPPVVVVSVDQPGGAKPTDISPSGESSSVEPDFDPRQLLMEFGKEMRNGGAPDLDNYHGPCYLDYLSIEYWHPPYSVRWTPDGKQLLFNSNLPDLGFGVNIVEVDSSRLRRLVNSHPEVSFGSTRLLLQTLLRERGMPTWYVEPLMEELFEVVSISLDSRRYCGAEGTLISLQTAPALHTRRAITQMMFWITVCLKPFSGL